MFGQCLFTLQESSYSKELERSNTKTISIKKREHGVEVNVDVAVVVKDVVCVTVGTVPGVVVAVEITVEVIVLVAVVGHCRTAGLYSIHSANSELAFGSQASVEVMLPSAYTLDLAFTFSSCAALNDA